MSKFIYCLLFALLASQAHAQVVLKRCANGNTVSANIPCPEEAAAPKQLYPIHGVIVHVPNTSYFTAQFKETSFNRAKNGAMYSCEKDTGSKECRAVLNVYAECVAVAVGSKYYAMAVANNAEAAKKRAMRTCTGTDKHPCKVELAFCT